MLVHARRTGVLPEEYRRLLFSAKNPASANTFLVDGVVAGTGPFEKGASRSSPSGAWLGTRGASSTRRPNASPSSIA